MTKGREEICDLPVSAYRPGTQTNIQPLFIVFKDGGIGDYICAMPAIRYMSREFPQVRGTILLQEFLRPLFQLFIESLPKWSLGGQKELDAANFADLPLCALNRHQMPNATGMHLVDIAFMQLINSDLLLLDNENRNYTQISSRLRGIKLKKEFRIKQRYAVLTVIATNELRQFPAEIFNGIKDYLLKRDILPVIVGNQKMGGRGLKIHDSYDFTGTLNLVDKTSLLEAAQIIERSQMIIGIDNGLLHIAGCTEVPIIFGYTIVAPRHRHPIRPIGRTIDIAPDTRELPCSFCHSRMRHLSHDFTKCLYGDIKCLEHLTLDRWRLAIEEILEG